MTTRRMAPAMGIGIVAIVALSAHVANAAELGNDRYVDGGSAAFQAGFVGGEIAAVRLVPASCPAQVQRIRLLFGGASGNRDVILHIWDDSAGGATPGNELFSARYSLSVSDTVLQEIALEDPGSWYAAHSASASKSWRTVCRASRATATARSTRTGISCSRKDPAGSELRLSGSPETG